MRMQVMAKIPKKSLVRGVSWGSIGLAHRVRVEPDDQTQDGERHQDDEHEGQTLSGSGLLLGLVTVVGH